MSKADKNSAAANNIDASSSSSLFEQEQEITSP